MWESVILPSTTMLSLFYCAVRTIENQSYTLLHVRPLRCQERETPILWTKNKHKVLETSSSPPSISNSPSSPALPVFPPRPYPSLSIIPVTVAILPFHSHTSSEIRKCGVLRPNNSDHISIWAASRDGDWARQLSETRSLQRDWVNVHAVNIPARLSSSLPYKQIVIWNDLLSDMSEDTKHTSVDQRRVMKNMVHTEQELCCISKQ